MMFLILLFLMVLLFGGTRAVGGVLGGALSIIGWLILAVLAVTLFGLALFVLPLILIVGAVSLITNIF